MKKTIPGLNNIPPIKRGSMGGPLEQSIIRAQQHAAKPPDRRKLQKSGPFDIATADADARARQMMDRSRDLQPQMRGERARGFELVKAEHIKNKEISAQLPKRSTKHSAGYDFISPTNYTLVPGEFMTVWTDIKAYMREDEYLQIYTRSGNGTKCGIKLRNQTGIIDPDYYNNQDNDGNIGVCLENTGETPFVINAGDKIAQGIFTRFLIVDEDDAKEERVGGHGSTNK